jgi:hypothetical protein
MTEQLRRFVMKYGHIYRFLTIAVVFSVICMPQNVFGEIKWRSGPVMIPALDRSELARRIPELAGRPKARHVVVQFKQSLGSAQRGQLRRAGLNLLDYVGNQAFFASIPAKVVDVPALSRMPFLAGLEPIQRAWKLHPRVLAGKVLLVPR